MELLIPGLILVALMVYASTRIKKTAAAAFEPESIETDKFNLEKPEGFLTVLNGDALLEYEGYSKEFGDEGAEDIKQARIEIRSFKNAKLAAAISRIKAATKVVSNTSEVIGEKKYALIEAETTNKNIEMLEFYKIAESGDGVLELRIIALAETNPEVARKIEIIVASFVVK